MLIKDGRISGIIDVDEMGVGDRLTYVALTQMALLNAGSDTDYVDYIADEMRLGEEERKILLLYTMIYCVDFMGERGMSFTDKKVEVNAEIIERLNGIYDRLMTEWRRFR